MRILTTTSRYNLPFNRAYPFLVLRADRWDDFGFKTMHHVELHRAQDDVVDLGEVKIIRLGLQPEETPLSFPTDIENLGKSYASLGQALSYYENLLANVAREQALKILEQLQDLAVRPERQRLFADEPAFETSLLREGSARRALTDATEILRGNALDARLDFEFETSVGGGVFKVDFHFGDREEIPSRMNAIIGYNGAGKTRLLANLARVAWQDASGRGRDAEDSGTLTPANIAFGRVVAVSYSAFDTFETPHVDPAYQRAKNGYRDYVYCGLRDMESGKGENRLKSAEEITRELASALSLLKTEERWSRLDRALAPLLREPSFQLSSTSIDFREGPDSWRPTFMKLSTGHKISLNTVVQLVAHLENKSLVLIDEPESHLHPPLLAALMKGIADALTETNSFAIVATHSPVVLQEVAARYVQVLRRIGHLTKPERPPAETFGENVGILTRTVFNLNNAESDYEGVLQRLGATFGTKGLSRIFPQGLSSQALAVVMQAEAEAAEEEGEVWAIGPDIF